MTIKVEPGRSRRGLPDCEFCGGTGRVSNPFAPTLHDCFCIAARRPTPLAELAGALRELGEVSHTASRQATDDVIRAMHDGESLGLLKAAVLVEALGRVTEGRP